ncbi:sugar ABC transporter permease [Pseudooceanicola sp. CBS1P-1]|uniref:ABC transporter permease subunit n=1 Tax=Pseudooceanicola albus TaxID=2692189 RepID=A0A6L7G5B0_9RHOB|nr:MULTISPECIES: sugar ABC transporter permease [Pseudooceanicola]MBT9385289.1 sugar ABC transporter permease [Pseudooceanicola endophyticus]MXN18852.1 ABC transporter permease subunit [Pseudooceanicola albus]
MSSARSRNRSRPSLAAGLSLGPAWVIVVAIYIGTAIWTVAMSLTTSRLLPTAQFAGLSQYRRLFTTPRWMQSLENLVLFGVVFIVVALVLGFLLAVALDRKIRFEGAIRTIYLYPYALSFIVTGVVWKWMLDPTMGIQKTMHDLGWTSFRMDWVVDMHMAIYALILAAVWQATGLVMALMLAGLRGVDGDLWKAIEVDGIPTWRAYVAIILPILKPIVVTATVLLGVAVVKAYDLVVALTGGGPGYATDMPAKFIMDFLFQRANIGLASAAATVILLISVLAILPWIYVTYLRAPRR